MARKEKKAVSPPTMSLAFIGGLLLFGVLAGAGYLWNKGQIDALGAQIRVLEGKLDQTKRRRSDLVRTYAKMCSPSDLDAMVKRRGLEIGPPQADQIVKLWEPVTATEEKLIAQRAAQKEEGRN